MITVADCKHMRAVTGFGIMECKELLLKFGNMDNAIAYLRSNSDEPQYEGLTKFRYDVLDETDTVVFTCSEEKELKASEYVMMTPCFQMKPGYHVRTVDCVGRYDELRIK